MLWRRSLVTLLLPALLVSSPSDASIASSFGFCGTWDEISPNLPAFHRNGHAMVYDSARDRMLIVGGDDGNASALTSVWALSLGATPSLTEIPTQGVTDQIGKIGISAVYDPVRDRIVLYGGIKPGGGQSGSVWELTLSGTPTWSELATAGNTPASRAHHTAIYDVSRDRMVVFGGLVDAAPDNQLWVLSFSGTPTWAHWQLGPGPVPRWDHSAIYDAPRDRMVLFGGTTNGSTTLNDAWTVPLSGLQLWSLIDTNGPGLPTARHSHSAIADAPRNRMLVFGGIDDGSNPLSDVWSLSFTNPNKWTQLDPTASVTVPSDDFASVYDPVRERMVTSMGAEFWVLTNLAGTPAWAQIGPLGPAPTERTGMVAIFDAPRNRMLVFGGVTVTSPWSRDLWAYSFASQSWSIIIASGQSPPGRSFASAVYDPAGDRLILFGGDSQQGPLNDAWQLSLSSTPTWTPLTPSGTPPPARFAHTAILDAPRNRMVIYGGEDQAAVVRSDVWALSLSGSTSWAQLSPTGGPAPGRKLHTAVFDAPRNRMLTFGWNDATVWALFLAGPAAWSTLAVSGTPPPTMSGHQAAYDATGDRMLVSLGDTYGLELSGAPSWEQVQTEAPVYGGRGFGSSVYDMVADRWVIFGGGNPAQNDVVALSLSPAFPLDVAASPAAGGIIQRSPSGTCLAPGTQVTLTAVPATDYGFLGWSGDTTGTANPITVTVDTVTSITANFATYTLTTQVSPEGAGSIARDPARTSYPPGTQVSLHATSGQFPFLGWSGDASGTANPIVVTMDGPKSVTAHYGAYTVAVNASPSSGGSVERVPSNDLYAAGSMVQINAVPSGGYAFTDWSGDASGSDNPLVLLVDANKTITANFALVPPVCASWTDLGPGAQARLGPAAAWDAVNDRVLRFGGSVGNTFLNDLWQFTVPGGWVQLSPNGTPPSPRNYAGLLYDSVRQRMLVIGGNSQSSGFLGDVWQLTLSGTPTWSQVTTSGAPPGEFAPSVIYDPVGDRVIRFGGLPFTNAVWSLSLDGTPTWTQIFPTGGPPTARAAAAAIYDPIRHRMLIHGGSSATNMLDDTWSLSLSGSPAWTLLPTFGEKPQVDQTAAIYDPLRDRMLIISGNGSTPNTDAVWALSLEVQPGWSRLQRGGDPPAPRFGHAAVYEPDLDAVLLFNGRLTGSTILLTDTRRFDLAGGYWLHTLAANGNVAVDPAKSCFAPNEQVTLFASPPGGVGFIQWLGDTSGSTNPLAITMDDNKVIYAEIVVPPVGVEDQPIAFAFGIQPNPVIGTPAIQYSLPREAVVSLRVFDVAGREVARLADGLQPAGRHTATWRPSSGARLRSGVYLVRYETPAGAWTRRMVLLR